MLLEKGRPFFLICISIFEMFISGIPKLNFFFKTVRGGGAHEKKRFKLEKYSILDELISYLSSRMEFMSRWIFLPVFMKYKLAYSFSSYDTSTIVKFVFFYF